jgi:hypothetical protein
VEASITKASTSNAQIADKPKVDLLGASQAELSIVDFRASHAL